MVNEFAYCPRLFYFEWVHGQWAENANTLEGAALHRRVQDESGTLPPPDVMEPEFRFVSRGILLSSDRLGLIARIDLLEGAKGKVRPVDYKRGRPGPRGPWEPELVQLCVQGLILRENGYACDEGVIYYADSRTRVNVPLTDELVQRTLHLVGELRRVARAPLPPPPLLDSPKCRSCVLVDLCLPDETNLLRGEPLAEVRRLVPARDDAAPIYVMEQGASIGRQGERLVVRTPAGREASARLIDVSQVSVYGNVQISSQALRALAERDVPILHHTYGGWLVAVTSGVLGRNADLRDEQYRAASDAPRALRIARAFVGGKIKNQRTLLRRNHPAAPRGALSEMARLIRLAQQASSVDRLLGIEGIAARVYFEHFGQMLRRPMGFDASGRQKRPPPDPVNALLSFAYGLLLKETIAALVAVGLDPYRGLYHQLRVGRPSLALDLMEEFRPLIADSVVLSLVNNRVLADSDFVRRGPACGLRAEGRRRTVRAFEARMDTLVRHPLFGYQVSYRRVVEIQARLLTRAISGEIPRYLPFTTR
ncbi:MAG: CRISPR-associated protein Cas1 [Thermoleophilia bacterium]